MVPIRLKRIAAAIAGTLFALSAAQADPCRSENFDGTAYTVCSFDLAKDDLRLFWKDSSDAPYRTFDALRDALKGEGKALGFAINGGMYGTDFSPTGLYVEDGKELAAANTKTVTGEPQDIPNFYKKPNGVFYVADGKAGVMTTEAWLAAKPAARFATQSGPMLLIDGAIHPAFIDGSTDLKRRDGVGVTGASGVVFALSEDAVNFHDFARFFRDGLGVRDALFLDGGSAPGIFAPSLDRDDAPGHGGYGPIIGVVE